MSKGTCVAWVLLVLVVVTSAAEVEYVGDAGYGGNDGYGSDGWYGGGYGGYGGGHGHGKWGDVEMFLKMRKLLVEVATNAVGLSELISLNKFNLELVGFPYALPGTLSLYVRELEKVPPYYKYGYLHKKPTGRGADDVSEVDDMM